MYKGKVLPTLLDELKRDIEYTVEAGKGAAVRVRLGGSIEVEGATRFYVQSGSELWLYDAIFSMECVNPGRPSRIVLSLLARAGIDVLSPVRALDLTYGRGTWWAEAPQAAVYGVDVRKLEWVRAPRCFRLATAQMWRQFADEVVQCLGGSPQVVAADPPWGAEGGLLRSLRPHWQRAAGSPHSIIKAALDAARHFGAVALVKWRERLPGVDVLAEACTKSPLATKRAATAWWAVVRP